MKKLLFIIIASFFIFLISCSQKSDNTSAAVSKGTITNISAEEAQKLLGNTNYIFIDVRQESEYIGWKINSSEGGHIEGAYDFTADWFDMLASDKDILTELGRKKIYLPMNLIIYDTKDADTNTAQKFADLGFHVMTLDGGIDAWIEKTKRPLEKMPNYEILVYPKWVYDLTQGNNPDIPKDKKFVIVELSYGDMEADYEKGHIPGAVHVDSKVIDVSGPQNLEEYEFLTLEEKAKFFRRPDDASIEKTLLSLGIDKDTLVIVYGPKPYANTRYALIMKYAGVEDVRVLNGGIKRYKADNLPLESGKVTPTPAASFGVKVPANPHWIIDLEEEKQLINDTNAVIASVRSWPEYLGEVSGYTFIGEANDIPNSRFAYAGSNPYNLLDYRNPDETMFNYQIIEDRWILWGITPDKRISFHCGTGWRASETLFYALALGWTNVTLYDGGWYEWHLYEDLPRKEKGVPKDAPETPVFHYTW